MNPYTYSRARYAARKNSSRSVPSWRGLWRDIFCAEISSVIAIAVVVLAAGSTMVVSSLAGSNFNNDTTVVVAHAAAGRVLGDSTGIRVGRVVYNPGNRTIYLVSQNGLYGFTDAGTFYGWGFSFGQVVVENSAEQALSVIGLVPAKISGCSNPLDQIAGTCGGSLTLPDTSSGVRVGKLVYSPASRTIFLVGQNKLYGFTDPATFYSWGFNFNDIQLANSAELSLPISSAYVPVKQSGCSSPLDQMNGSCGQQLGGLTKPTIDGPAAVTAGTIATYNFTATSPYGSINYAINWGDGSAIDYGSNLGSGQADTQYHRWQNSGNYTITVTVTDAKGATSSSTQSVTVTASATAASGPFQLSQNSFNFTVHLGDTVYQQQSMTFTNVTNSSLSFHLGVDNQPSWLNTSYNADLLTASPNQLIGLGASVDPTKFASVGSYSANIKISGSFTGSPVVVPVYVVVLPQTNTVQPSITINDFSLLPATVGQPYSSVAISYSQTGSTNPILVGFNGLPNGMGMPQTMGGIVTSSTYSQTMSGSVISLAGTPTIPGTYNVTLTVSNQSGVTKTKQFVLVVNPAAPANVTVSPTALSFTSTNGSSPATQALTVSGVTFGSDASPALMIQVSSNSLSWLGVSSSNQGFGGSILSLANNGTFYISVKVPASPGNYSGSILINNMTGAYPTVALTVPVTLVVSTASTVTQPTINGATSVQVGTTNNYMVVSTSSNGGTVNYQTNWGDGSALSYSGGLPSGIPWNAYHAWQSSGTYTVTITATSQSGASATNTIQIKVNTPTVQNLNVSPSSLSFSANGNVPPAQSLSLTGLSGQWIATLNPVGSWLRVNGGSGGATGIIGSTFFSVSVDPSSLAAGTYSGSIIINSYDNPARFSPVTIPVTMTVSSAPVASVSIVPHFTISDFTMPQGHAPQQSSSYVSFSVGSGQMISWVAQPSAGWIAVSPSGQSFNTGTASVSVNPYVANTLAPGTYYGTITFSPAPGSSVTWAPQAVSVSLTVTAAPAAPSVNYMINKTLFNANDTWVLAINSNIPNAVVKICAGKIPAPANASCSLASSLGLPATTNINGQWTASGTFSAGDGNAGSWNQYAVVGDTQSNQISFTVNQ